MSNAAKAIGASGCPVCGSIGMLMAGRVLFEGCKQHHGAMFRACFDHDMAIKQGEQKWRRMSELATERSEWIKRTPYHWQMTINGKTLDYWPTRRKFQWMGSISTGDVMSFIVSLEKS